MKEEYKNLIMELLDKIENGRFLYRIYISLREYAKESGHPDGEPAETMVQPMDMEQNTKRRNLWQKIQCMIMSHADLYMRLGTQWKA